MDITKHRLYKKAKNKFYFSRWIWVIWNATVSIAFFLQANIFDNFSYFNFALFCLTSLMALFLMMVMPRGTFENSKDCENIKSQISDTKTS
ncbi:hypothetical protein AAKU52_002369 [Pedobacter sp. CG_S7]